MKNPRVRNRRVTITRDADGAQVVMWFEPNPPITLDGGVWARKDGAKKNPDGPPATIRYRWFRAIFNIEIAPGEKRSVRFKRACLDKLNTEPQPRKNRKPRK